MITAITTRAVPYKIRAGDKMGKADIVVEFVRPGSDEAKPIDRLPLREVERPKYRPSKIATMMKAEVMAGSA
jgi:hypothetical protein